MDPDIAHATVSRALGIAASQLGISSYSRVTYTLHENRFVDVEFFTPSGVSRGSARVPPEEDE